MKQNSVKHMLADGGVSVGTMFMEFATDGIGRIAANAGAEFGVFDMEHSGWHIQTMKMLMGTTRLTRMVPLVRIPAIQYHYVSRALDAGAMGIVSPIVEDAEQAKQIVKFAKYPPKGQRGVAFNLANDDYTDSDVPAKMKHSNDETLIVIQIETARGVENVDSIAAVDGVDVLWIGQFDLTASLGIPGQFNHPDFDRAVNTVQEASQRHGKAAGYGSLNLEEVKMRRDQGFRFLVYTADVWIYQQALRQGIHAIRDGTDNHL